jgi:glycosyltransferase involved in cell wall biosynthesis
MTDDERLWVTIDARALDGALMGTQILVLELTRALAHTGALRLRVLIYAERIDAETLELLRELPDTEILAGEEVDESTPASTVLHRPQQAFAQEDVGLAWQLGERVVLGQLDLIAYNNRDYFSDTRAWEDYRRASRHGMIAAERVLVLSAHTRDELTKNGLVDAERIRIVPPGLDHRIGGSPRRPAALQKPQAQIEGHGTTGAGPDEPEPEFLLCLGTDYRHKNRVFALRLLAALRERHDWQGTLVLAGTHIEHGSSRQAERDELDAHPQLREAVIELGAVAEAEKEWLVQHAAAVVYPSEYEGFGLVPYESALRGVPCLFAAQSSLAEGAMGEAATIVPWDPVQSAAAAYPLLTDEEACARHVQLLADAARELTWQRAAEATVQAYREAALAPAREATTLSHDAVARERQLIADHQEVVQKLIDERELVLGDYNELLAEVGPARGLIGEHGTLPSDLQRALLALSAHPALSRPVYGFLAAVFRGSRALTRLVRRP